MCVECCWRCPSRRGRGGTRRWRGRTMQLPSPLRSTSIVSAPLSAPAASRPARSRQETLEPERGRVSATAELAWQGVSASYVAGVCSCCARVKALCVAGERAFLSQPQTSRPAAAAVSGIGGSAVAGATPGREEGRAACGRGVHGITRACR